ncbi:tetratricopeptide repeat-containing sensor histidine kinase [Flagellimonas zhangzhouensis]|uniref:Tetratricopeptide repeat-containing protein n=1 Tax=Flagellimonas zhangzhouensis TaxID=1073328 RepID=A0A1H2SX32_9FLAO|nr:tetratricopeptide repeat protein [Allomuricauda zhangzhouensis]SDQ80695.1 Tetratricopeptide repeat-containing protein [Allomuricauda zhangzhouensis]SDW36140.1 Tetratricopeptide repeat-containing protein [Allomuricauda zhangzhouensis]
MKPSQTLIPTLWVVLLIGQFCLSQTKELDSLQNLMKTADDTTQVKLLRSQSIAIRSLDVEKSIDLIQQSIEKSREIEYAQGEIKGIYTLALTHGMTSNYVESLEYLKQCLELTKQHNDFDTLINLFNTFGIIYKRIGDYPTSQEYYLEGLKIADSVQYYEDVHFIYGNLGLLYDKMDEDEKAIENYQKAIDSYQRSVENYGRAYSETFKSSMYADMAEIDLKHKDYDAALEKLLPAATIFQNNNSTLQLSQVYSNIGLCYLNLKQWSLSEDYLLKSLQTAIKHSLKQEIALAYENLANLMFQQNKMENALEYSNKNLEALKVMGEYENKQKAHDLAAQIHEQIGNYGKANEHLKQSMVYQDSLLNETKVKEIQNLQILHDVYIKDRELKENELQMALLGSEISLNNKRMTYLIIISLLLLFSASLLYFRFRSKKKSNAVLLEKNTLISEQNQTIESMNKELEKRMLRAQMNPHFIFNSLNSIQSLIHANDRENALNYLCKFSKLLRQVLESSINISLLLSEEIKLLKIYVELEALRFDNSFQYVFHIDENLDVDAHEVPMLLVQPYIENAIIHGLMPKEGSKQLNLYFNDSPEFIECIIEDNGVGISSNQNKKQSDRISRGMSITEKRIDALKKFTNLDLVQIENLNKGTATGTRVTILIPKED